MSYNTYSPLYLGRKKTRRAYEVGDELAPGGPVSFWRTNRGNNNGVNDQYQYNERQYEQPMNEPPQDPWDPPPLMRLRQPLFQSQRYSPQELEPPSVNKFRQELLSPGRKLLPSTLQQELFPSVQVSKFAPREKVVSPELKFRGEYFFPVDQLHESTQEEEFMPVRRLRQPALKQVFSSGEFRRPGQQQPIPQNEQTPVPQKILPMKQVRRPSPEPRQPSPEQHQPSPPPQPSPPLCEDVEENQSNTAQITKKAVVTGKADPVKKSLDKSNTENTSGNHAGVKIKKRVGNREWRRRQNLHLRRILAPKNALIVLNEMLPGDYSIGQFKVEPAPAYTHSVAPNAHHFCAKLTVDSVNYTGYGRSKLAARNDAAEQVFRDIILKHMVKLQRRYEARPRGVEVAEDKEAEDSSDEEDTLPMIQLASFALHKLFAEWEGRGHKVPQLKALTPPVGGEEGEVTDCIPRGPRVRTLPSNAGSMHPCLLLAQLQPDLQFRAVSATAPYSMAIDIDGVTYTGTAASKREARREAARSACVQHFGVKFDDGPSTPSAPNAPSTDHV